MRFLRAAVHLRRLKRQPKVAANLARVRQGLPYAGSLILNAGLILVLALGYASFVAKGIPGAGLGERRHIVHHVDEPPARGALEQRLEGIVLAVAAGDAGEVRHPLRFSAAQDRAQSRGQLAQLTRKRPVRSWCSSAVLMSWPSVLLA